MIKMGKGGFLREIVSSGSGVSSKRLIGGVSYFALVLGSIILSFTNPDFQGLEDILITLIITSSGLLGITTIENINKKKGRKNDT